MNPSHSRAGLWHLRQQVAQTPQDIQHNSAFRILDDARSMGVCMIASKGSGKSVVIGRTIAFQDCLRGIPQVIIDPVGTVGDNLLDEILRMPEPMRQQALARIRYVDISGRSGYLIAWPLFVRHPGQSLYQTAQAFSEVIERTDPNLSSAPVEGLNAFIENATAVGMVATALGWQITEAEQLLTPSPAVVQRLLDLAQDTPEVRAATTYLLETLPSLKPAEKERKLSSFRRKTAVFTHDPTLRAMMGADTPTIDWAAAVERGETLIFDFRFVGESNRRFLLLWVFRRFLEFVRSRGAGRHTPVGLIIDELLALYHLDQQAGQSVFASDLDELLNILARNYRIWVTLAFQEIFQLDRRAQKTVLSMGTKIFGVTTDPEAAQTIASIVHAYDPTLIKAFIPVYDARGNLVDAQPLYWSVQEQELLVANELRRLKPFHFLVMRAGSEGDSAGRVEPLYVPAKERGAWVQEDKVTLLRTELSARTGASQAALLTQIEERSADFVMTTRTQSREENPHATLESNAQNNNETIFDIRAGFGESV